MRIQTCLDPAKATMRIRASGRIPTCVKHLGDLCKTRQFDEALALACSMDQHNIPISRELIYSLLQGYASKKDIGGIKKIQMLMVHNKLDRIAVLGDHLIRLFVTCGSLQEAQQVFDNVRKPSVYTWNAILTAHCKLGNIENAFEIFYCMQKSGTKPDKITILCILKACGSIGDTEKGRLIHTQILRGDFELDMVLASTLVDMYAKCGSLDDAYKIFNGFSTRDVVVWGALLAGYAQHDDGVTALKLFDAMQVEGIISNEVVFSSVLKACGSVAAIEAGKIVHSQVIEAGVDSEFVVGSSMVDMYAKCRRLEDAQKVFQSLSHRDSTLWGTMVAGYTLCGEDQLALDAFNEMLQEDFTPSQPMLLCVLKAVRGLSSTSQGRVLHDLLMRFELETDLIVANALIDMYARCTLVAEAQRVFDCMSKRDIVSWAALIAGYVEHNECEMAISLFLKMQEHGISPDRVLILSVLRACTGSNNIAWGRAIHNQLDKWGLELDVTLRNALIDMYSKCGSLSEARIVFDESKDQDEVPWGALISGHAHCGDDQAALELLKEMLDEGKELDKVVLLGSIKACSSARAIFEGRFLHNGVVESGLMSDLDIGSMLINMYARCGCLEDACQVFNDLPSRDSIAWTSIIVAYAEHGEGTSAVELFEKMQEEGIGYNELIFLCIIRTCGGLCSLSQCRLLHHQILKGGFESSAEVTNFFIRMYAKFGNFREACQMFDLSEHRDEMSCGRIIAGFIHEGYAAMPFDLCWCVEDLTFRKEMLVCILKACGNTSCLEQGRLVHIIVVETGLEANIMVGNSLVHMYAKSGSLYDAFEVFDRLPTQDLVTYSTMIARLAEADLYMPALHLSMRLQGEGLKADKHAYQCLLKVYGALSLIKLGRHIHNQIITDALDLDTEVSCALVDMYTKCGSLGEAEKVLCQVSISDNKLWGAIIAGYTQQGDCQRVLCSLEDMKRQGVKPTVRTFSSILSACSHAGTSNEGQQCFKSMTDEYGVIPRAEHLNSMVDLFGRTGHLQLAADFLIAMPTCPDVVGQRSLLTNYQKYGSAGLGHECFDQVIHMEAEGTLGFSCMSHADCRNDAHASTAPLRACKQARPVLLEMDTLGGSLRTKDKIKGYTPQVNVCVDILQADDLCVVANKEDIRSFKDKNNRAFASAHSRMFVRAKQLSVA